MNALTRTRVYERREKLDGQEHVAGGQARRAGLVSPPLPPRRTCLIKGRIWGNNRKWKINLNFLSLQFLHVSEGLFSFFFMFLKKKSIFTKKYPELKTTSASFLLGWLSPVVPHNAERWDY